MTPFTKMQAIGNDFIVIAEPENTDLAALALRVCDRRFGIGADGLLIYQPQAVGLRFRIFNADGSEDTMWGSCRNAVLQGGQCGARSGGNRNRGSRAVRL